MESTAVRGQRRAEARVRVPGNIAAILLAGLVSQVTASEPVAVGLGSYSTELHPGAKGPPATVYRTERASCPMPTSDWWSSLAWVPFSERQYPHPLAVQAQRGGLRVYYPGPSIAANPKGIFGSMPGSSGDDVTVGHSEIDAFPDARVEGWSDWFVSARFGDSARGMTVAYGHGSPYVYARFEGGTARLVFSRPPEVWSAKATGAALGVTANGRHYGLFGPTGSRWTGLGTEALVNEAGAKRHFSLAILPERSEEVLELFSLHAHAHVTDTRVSWRYDDAARTVVATFAFTTEALEGSGKDTLFALYPHQRRALAETSLPALLPYRYASVRGTMALAKGSAFAVGIPVPPVLPALPVVGAVDREKFREYLREEEEAARTRGDARDTYWEGKRLGRLATALSIAEEARELDTAQALRAALRSRLESWLKAQDPEPPPKDAPQRERPEQRKGQATRKGLFYHDATWATLIGYPASYGSDAELNDHHFHYGYFIRAAADLARHDPAWADDRRWGGMVKMLIRDIASPDRRDPLFPFLRCFDPYAGHSWASGSAKFGDGNNQESSSEAMNAWYGILLWGEATGDRELRDLGLYLYAAEAQGIEEYWFDVRGENRPPTYTPAVVTMVWGGKGVNETWFTANPEAVHGINWLPIHAGSLYLGTWPDSVRKNYDALVRENGGDRWDEWEDLIWMYLALAEPEKALAQLAAREEAFKPEAGNSRANAHCWIHALAELGQVDGGVRGDLPFSACFRKGSVRTYVACDPGRGPAGAIREARFSDGTVLRIEGKGLAVERRTVD